MPLPIDHLHALGLPAEAVELWRGIGIQNLLPLQEHALAQHGLLHGQSLLVCAPTASGKTLLAELAALRHLAANRRVVFCVPTRALAEEKYRLFHDFYGRLGYRVAVATRERPDTDGRVLGGRYDLLVAVYEKLKAHLVAKPEMLAEVGCIVADEVQTLGEPGRGATLDLLLTKIRQAPYSPQMIALSAVLGEDASRLAGWLGCDLLSFRQRPLELREGAYDASRGEFVYRGFNSGERGTEILDDERAGEPLDEAHWSDEPEDFRREVLLDLAVLLARDQGEQVLIFVPTRYASRNWAHHLAESQMFASADEALEEIAGYEATNSRDLLLETLRSGVGFHNADLSWDLRGLIECHFNAGNIRVLISTPTLGQGVNLRGRNVLHVPAMVVGDRWTGRQNIVALSRSRFRNQGGRGARLGGDGAFGRSILVARNQAEATRLLRDYVEGDLEPLPPQMERDSLGTHVLDLLASRVARDERELEAFFHQTFSGRQSWAAEPGGAGRALRAALTELREGRLCEEDAQGNLQATGLGEVAAGTGLQPQTVTRFAQWIEEDPAEEMDPLEALIVTAGTGDGRDFPAGRPGPPAAAQAWIEACRERLLHGDYAITDTVRGILEPSGGFTGEAMLDFKKALVLDAWIGAEETRSIEERFSLYSGTIGNLAGHFSWLIQGMAAIVGALAGPVALREKLTDLGERLTLGAPAEGLGFRAVRAAGFSRSYLQILLREGYTNPRSVADAGEEPIVALIPRAVTVDLVAECRRLFAGEGPRPKKTVPVETPQSLPGNSGVESVPGSEDANEKPVLVIDERGPGRAWLCDREVALAVLPFRLLQLLVERGETGASYEEIEAVLWPDTQVERQNIYAHRRTLQNAFDEASVDLRIETRAGRGLVLHAQPGSVRVTPSGSKS